MIGRVLWSVPPRECARGYVLKEDLLKVRRRLHTAERADGAACL